MRTPMGRFGEAEEVVGAAVFLASEAASFVTGQIDGRGRRLSGQWGESVRQGLGNRD